MILRRPHLALIALGLAAALYAFLSSPTPDTPGLIEFTILTLLVVAAVCARIVREPWCAAFIVLLAYGFTVPLLVGTLQGHAAGDMLRDIVAFAALGVPLVFAWLYPPDDRMAQKALLFMLLGVGFVFAARYLFASAASLASLGMAPLDHNLLYLANSPLVAFAASWMLLYGCFHERRLWLAGVLVLLSLIPLAAMIGMMQRATIVLLALAWLGFFVFTLMRNPKRAAIVAVALAMLCILIWPLPHLAADSLLEKTLMVGWNAREAEFAALFDALNQNPLTAIFGAGWGSMMKSPAVGDLWVRFSHALATSLLWKCGWVGLVLGAAAIIALVKQAARRLKGQAATLVALMLPLLPALFLYGSYKSLCFGLLLLGLARLNWTYQPQR